MNQHESETEFREPKDSDLKRWRDKLALIFAILFPTLVTWIYFELLKNSDPEIQQVAYGVGKTFQFTFPVVWTWLFFRNKLKDLVFGIWISKDKTQNSAHWIYGVAFGAAVVVAMFGLYFGWIQGSAVGNDLTEMVRQKVVGFGFDSAFKYLGLAIFYSLMHSFLEEYYWRWFVYEHLKQFMSISWSNLISSIGFALHHVILLAFFFGWESPFTYLLSVCIAIGGCFWAWQFQQTGKMRFPWISHMIVDAGIFGLGYFLIAPILTA
ncbi:MAG: CPBP family intramembrane glutamic endopeptidase [Planctomycetota bacterium]